MEVLAVVFIYALIAAIGFLRRGRPVREQETASLCHTCRYAVITRGTRSEECIACNYGGSLRAVNFTVRECTGYSVRGESSRLVIIEGFKPENREVYAEIAIS